jgi:hypothetical protein
MGSGAAIEASAIRRATGCVGSPLRVLPCQPPSAAGGHAGGFAVPGIMQVESGQRRGLAGVR